MPFKHLQRQPASFPDFEINKKLLFWQENGGGGADFYKSDGEREEGGTKAVMQRKLRRDTKKQKV